ARRRCERHVFLAMALIRHGRWTSHGQAGHRRRGGAVSAPVRAGTGTRRRPGHRPPHTDDIMSLLHDDITATIGNTPIVRLNRIGPDHVQLYAKVESFNPGASVKDRLALAIILDAERKGLLKPGDTVIEATSGNTGIALAMVCAARGYRFVATMVETFSIERRKL